MVIKRHSARLVVNPITVDSYDFLFNCKTVGQATDLMMTLFRWLVPDVSRWLVPP